MDSRIGLDYVVENPEYIAKLAGALDTGNVTVKKQVLELLSALCVYNAEGYARALDALEHYKELKGERYRFHIIISELRGATTVDYQTAIIAFINCLIISTPQLKDRIRIRNEFIGLKLLPVLNDLRRLAVRYPDLGVQLDVFDEQRESDEAQILQGPYGVDLNSHLDVFYSILRQVADTPQEIPFLSILQHLLRVDPKEPVSDAIWDTAETLVHRATLLESRQDATRLLRSPSQTKLCCPCACHQHRGTSGTDVGSRKQSLNTTPSTPSVILPPPPPPPPLPLLPGPPPPPPPPPLCPPGAPPPPPPLSKMGGPPVPPPLHTPAVAPACSPEPPEISNKLLPQQETPTPKAKMKTINWNKIPNHKVLGKRNIWSLVASSHQHSPMADLDWAEMEGLFCQQAPPAPTAQSSPRLGRDPQDPDRKRKESSEIVLLDGKRSLNVNIFLKQFRSCNEDIIQLIRDGAHDDIGAEKLRGLLKLLPEVDELEMLRSFDGDKTKLGNAEKFLLQLIQVPNYKLRIESMLLKEEFAANMGYLEPSINAMIVAGEDLMTNKPLQEVLYMVLVAGNFLNSGGYAGNAAGVKLSSLQKLTDIRANKPGMNLIHFVALQIEKKRRDLLHFPEEMTILEEATKTTVEQLQNEINALDARIKKIKKLIDQPSTEKEIKMQMGEFLQMAEQEVAALQKDMEELELTRKTLSDFFCEDPNTFKIEECFRIIHGLCTKFRQAVIDNERRRMQEEQANARRRQREEQLAAKRKQYAGQIGQNVSESEGNLVDSLLYDINSGLSQNRNFEKDSKARKLQNGSMTSEEDISITGSPLVTRRRMGSFSGPTGDQALSANKDDGSPDITPNGSLRRRRSRVPSEEDDSNLMDFLRSSGQETGRERKSWGSLDRSWARRARGGGRKRPELLSADFSGERERPSSPSPLAESKPILPAPSENETKPKAWRQKIEAWLQENEKEEKQSEELRRRSRRVQSNRRSLELDSESDGRGSTLDTLPEEKSTTTNTQYKRVYSDWRPTIEKTDVAGVIEAIEEAQPQTPVKDKSPWRKSNLNVSNSTEDTQMDVRKLRRMRSRGSMEGTPTNGTLQSIKEEGKKKEIIGALGQCISDQDRLTLYIRRPSDVEPENNQKTAKQPETRDQRRPQSIELSDSGSGSLPNSPLLSRSQLLQKYRHSMEVTNDFLKSIVGEKTKSEGVTKQDDDQLLPPSVPRRVKKQNESTTVSDRIEIDSDNIETPPVTRRNFRELRGGNKSLEEGSYSKKSSYRSPADDKNVPDLSLEVLRRRFIDKDMEALNKNEMELPQRKSSPSESRNSKVNEDEEILGDGQFNRFSSARRTRRYKKNNMETSDKEAGSSHGEETSNSPVRRAEVVSPELVSEKQIIRPATLKVQSYSVSGSPSKCEDTDTRLKKWQERLKYKGGRGDSSDLVTEEAVANITSAGEELQNIDKMTSPHYKLLSKEDGRNDRLDRIHRIDKEQRRDRVRSLIDGKHVKEAISLGSNSLDRAAISNLAKSKREQSSEVQTHGILLENERSLPITVGGEERLYESNDKSLVKSDFIPEIRVHSSISIPNKTPNSKTEHELNDEGFEETQSLISETPSQGTSSGCNYEADVTDSPKKHEKEKRRSGRLIRADSSGSGDTSSSTNPSQFTPISNNTKMPLKKETSLKVLNTKKETPKSNTFSNHKIKSIGTPRYNTLERSSSVKATKPRETDRLTRKNGLARSESLKKTDSQNSLSSRASSGPAQRKKSVERSNSRTSLRSSRSSLNSATSVNTVKNIPPLSRTSSLAASKTKAQLSGYTSAIKNLTSNLNKESSGKFGYQNNNRNTVKKPLATVQLKSSSQKSVPASRSSSSGSSIGPTIRRPRVTTGVSTSFKENNDVTREQTVPASRSSSSGSSIGPSVRRPKPSSNSTVLSKETSSPTGRIPTHCGLSFMRPTASSSAKDHTSIVEQPSIKLRTIAKTIK